MTEPMSPRDLREKKAAILSWFRHRVRVYEERYGCPKKAWLYACTQAEAKCKEIKIEPFPPFGKKQKKKSKGELKHWKKARLEGNK